MAEQFDPRFDPAFQPGYDPNAYAPSRRNTPSGVPDSTELITSLGERDGDQFESAGHDEPDAFQPEPVEPNPFERTLWVVAVVLVVAGGSAAFWANSTMFSSPGTVLEWQQILQTSAWSLSSPMVTVGFGTGVALLFRRALTWDSASEKLAAEIEAKIGNEHRATS